MLPALVGGLGALYSVGKAVDSVRYWNDYYKRTGRFPKYPFRSGAFDSMSYAVGSAYAFSRLKRL